MPLPPVPPEPVVLICPDSFKGTLTARQAADAMARAVLTVWPRARVITRPLADGGEGTLEALLSAGGTRHEMLVQGPMGDPVKAHWGTLPDGEAVVEMAQASGLTLVPEDRRDPRLASTYGTGQLLRAAIESGAERIIVGIGGSATNDGGAGAMQALGASFRDGNGQELRRGGLALADLTLLTLPSLPIPEVIVASDVDNPLCGPEGATLMFGPQKGATPQIAAQLEGALRVYARVLRNTFGWAVDEAPGAGAAGGLGAALLAFLHARFCPGIDVVMDVVGFDEAASEADLILTGEGKMDAQSLHGKTIAGVVRRACGTPVAAVCGAVDLTDDARHAMGLAMVAGVMDISETAATAFSRPAEALELRTRLALLSEEDRCAASRR